MEIRIRGMAGFTLSEQARIVEACEKLPAVLNSNLFKVAVLYAPFTETKGLKNLQIYDLLMSGADPLRDGSKPADGILDVDLVGYMSWWSRVIGWTKLGASQSHFNRKFFGAFKAENIAGNILHEAMHRLGFMHLGQWSTSIPYQIGTIVVKVWHEVYKPNAFVSTAPPKGNLEINLVV